MTTDTALTAVDLEELELMIANADLDVAGEENLQPGDIGMPPDYNGTRLTIKATGPEIQRFISPIQKKLRHATDALGVPDTHIEIAHLRPEFRRHFGRGDILNNRSGPDFGQYPVLPTALTFSNLWHYGTY